MCLGAADLLDSFFGIRLRCPERKQHNCAWLIRIRNANCDSGTVFPYTKAFAVSENAITFGRVAGVDGNANLQYHIYNIA